MNWLVNLLSKLFSSLSLIGLQALYDFILNKIKESKKNKELEDAAKKLKEAKSEQEKKDAFRDLINKSKSE